MGLDMQELLAEWDCPDGEVGARMIVGRDGSEVLQLRIELGVLQMTLDGRPDGARYHGMANALEYIEHELKAGTSQPADEAWDELEREFSQYNYRRVALSSLVDQAVTTASGDSSRPYLMQALSDVEVCTRILDLLQRIRGDAGENGQHRPTLAFNKARLTAQLHVMDRQFDEAIEEVSRGCECLEALLTDLGIEVEDRDQDPGLTYLRELEEQIRVEYDVKFTLRERLESAIDSEDFETAARLRDELRKRYDSRPRGLPAPPDEQ